MNTQKLEIAISQLERVHRDMNDCANRFILKDAIDQLQEQVKLFCQPAVISSFCHHNGTYTTVTDSNGNEVCCKCKKPLAK